MKVDRTKLYKKIEGAIAKGVANGEEVDTTAKSIMDTVWRLIDWVQVYENKGLDIIKSPYIEYYAKSSGKELKSRFRFCLVPNGKALKPLSELTKEDAIEIAKAGMEYKQSDIIECSVTKHVSCIEVILIDDFGAENQFYILLDRFFCKRVINLDSFSSGTFYNSAAATDKARELGYDV